jgi:protein-S-isoprenylcysteine O-methyltransferase Ste14
VRTGFVVGLAVMLLAQPTLRSLLLGLPLVLLGEAIRLWASGHIDKTRVLATGGPYAHTRNPLYLGSFCMGLGVALATASPWSVALVAAYFIAFYPAVMREEAAFLRGKFPDQFPGWAAAVPGFLPRLTPGGPRESRFAWSRIQVNRELRTVLAIPLLFALLYGWSVYRP